MGEESDIDDEFLADLLTANNGDGQGQDSHIVHPSDNEPQKTVDGFTSELLKIEQEPSNRKRRPKAAPQTSSDVLHEIGNDRDAGPSLLHRGDTDSSDDEDRRNCQEARLSDYGRSIKTLMPKENLNKDYTATKSMSWGARKVSSQSVFAAAVAAPVKEVVDADPVFGLRISNPLVSGAGLQERMVGRTPVSMAEMKRFVESGREKDTDWVVAGVVVYKSHVMTSQKGAQYSLWRISDLKGTLKKVSLFLFRSAHKEMWKTSVGTILAVLNPDVLDNRDFNDEAALSVSTSEKVMVLGASKDYGICKANKKNGEKCTAFVNVSTVAFCIYHIKQEYQKCSRRSELQSPTPRVSLRNKVLGKNEVFYGGRSFMSVPSGKQNRNHVKRDEARLKALTASSSGRGGHPSLGDRAVELNRLQQQRDEARLAILASSASREGVAGASAALGDDPRSRTLESPLDEVAGTRPKKLSFGVSKPLSSSRSDSGGSDFGNDSEREGKKKTIKRSFPPNSSDTRLASQELLSKSLVEKRSRQTLAKKETEEDVADRLDVGREERRNSALHSGGLRAKTCDTEDGDEAHNHQSPSLTKNPAESEIRNQTTVGGAVKRKAALKSDTCKESKGAKLREKFRAAEVDDGREGRAKPSPARETTEKQRDVGKQTTQIVGDCDREEKTEQNKAGLENKDLENKLKLQNACYPHDETTSTRNNAKKLDSDFGCAEQGDILGLEKRLESKTKRQGVGHSTPSTSYRDPERKISLGSREAIESMDRRDKHSGLRCRSPLELEGEDNISSSQLQPRTHLSLQEGKSSVDMSQDVQNKTVIGKRDLSGLVANGRLHVEETTSGSDDVKREHVRTPSQPGTSTTSSKNGELPSLALNGSDVANLSKSSVDSALADLLGEELDFGEEFDIIEDWVSTEGKTAIKMSGGDASEVKSKPGRTERGTNARESGRKACESKAGLAGDERRSKLKDVDGGSKPAKCVTPSVGKKSGEKTASSQPAEKDRGDSWIIRRFKQQRKARQEKVDDIVVPEGIRLNPRLDPQEMKPKEENGVLPSAKSFLLSMKVGGPRPVPSLSVPRSSKSTKVAIAETSERRHQESVGRPGWEELAPERRPSVSAANVVPQTVCSVPPAPRLSLGNSGGVIDFSTPIPKNKIEQAKARAIQWARKNGGLSKPLSVKKTEAAVAVKRKLETLETGESATEKARKLEQAAKEAKLRVLMETQSRHVDLLAVHDDREKEEYFDKLEKKEKMEEQMSQTYQLQCKAVTCLECKYTAFSAAEICRSDGHRLRVTEGVKRFFKCADCGNRTVSLRRLPTTTCTKCQSSRWERAPMMRERKAETTSVPLSIRGGEEKYLGSLQSDGHVGLLVPM